MKKPLLAAIAALAVAALASASAPAHAGMILTVTPSSQTVVRPDSGSVIIEFQLHASADGPSDTPFGGINFDGLADGNLGWGPTDLDDLLFDLAATGGTLDQKITITVTSASLLGAWSGTVAMGQGEETVSATFRVVVTGPGVVPEPSSLALGATGIVLFGAFSLRRRRAS